LQQDIAKIYIIPMKTSNLSILPIRLGAIPIVDRYIETLKLEKLLEEVVPSDPRDKIPVWKTLSIILRNIILERHPLYKIGQWAHTRNLLSSSLCNCMTDDRIGRSLDRLFRSDRASLITKVILKAIDSFKVTIQKVHNDSTTVTLTGNYTNYRNGKSAQPQHGVNKDFRPDLRQLLFSLSVSGDEAIPLYFKVWDGNTTDDTTHLRNWMALRNLLGTSDFIYVADSKLCVRETMLFIDTEGGSFITVLPETRAEIDRFKQWIQTNTPQWHQAIKKPNPRGRELPPHIFWTFDSPFSSSEGFRIVWVKSSQKQLDDEQRRTRRIAACEEELLSIAKKKHRNKEKLQKSVETVLNYYHTSRYFDWKITIFSEEQYKQTRRGRPDENTAYRKICKEYYQLTWCQNPQAILFDTRYDGIFPLVSNNMHCKASDILHSYKFQPRLERRFEQLKTVYQVAPVFLKNPQRIESLLLLYFLALLITALVERTVRKSMKEHGIGSIPIYPEERACKAPTADKIPGLFDDIRLQYIMNGKEIVKSVEDNLSEIQKQVLWLLKIKQKDFFSGNC